MTNPPFFPAVLTEYLGDTGMFRSTVGLKVISILDPQLRSGNSGDAGVTAAIYLAHRSIMETVAAWPETVTLILNLVSQPDITYPLRGKIHMTIMLSAANSDKQAATAEVLSRYAVLWALLNNYLPDVEFKTIFNDDVLRNVMRPLEINYALSIERDRGSLSAALPADQKPGMPIGFLSIPAPKHCKKQTDNEPLEIPYIFPWSPSHVDISEIVESILWHPSPFWLHIRFRPLTSTQASVNSQLMDGLRRCEEILKDQQGTQTVFELQTLALRSAITRQLQQMREPVLQGAVFLCCPVKIDEAIISSVAQTISARVLDFSPEESYVGGYRIRAVNPADVLNFDAYPDQWPLTPSEAACAFRIPHPVKSTTRGIPMKKFRTSLASPQSKALRDNEYVTIGRSVHRGYEQPVRLDANDRMRHLCVLGQTGTGKSTMFENLIIQDILEGRGLCLLDPHGELLEAVLNRFPWQRRDDLIIIDFLDREYPIPMNLLKWEMPEERDFIIDELYATMDREYDMKQTGGPIFEQYFRGMLRLLMGDKPQGTFVPTLLEFPLLFSQREFRDFCRRGIEDNQVICFLDQAEDAGGDARLSNVTPYINSKFNRFLLDTTLKRVIGQEEIAFDFSEIMDTGKVVLVNLGKGRFGASVSGFLCSQLVSRFRTAAMARADQPPESRRDFYLYVDEFQNIADNDTFAELLSEARKYRLSLNLANQYADQLAQKNEKTGNSLLSAILGNVGTIVTFRLGIKDAEKLKPAFIPSFNDHDLANLPNYTSYVRMNTEHSKPTAFSMENIYEKVKADPGRVSELKEMSRKRYGRDVLLVDEQIGKRMEKINELMN
jgi:hypothetical protein